MEIGAKIKAARVSAGLTQEQAAQALAVSRQTISNWENGKTYPDIVSVVRMSDLYSISLDRLLKEEESSVSDYLNYLEESTNVTASKSKLAKLILIITYLVIWSFSLIVFWFFTSGSDAMGYSLMFLVVLLPVTTFVLSLLIGRNDHWGQRSWISALFFGIMYMLAEYGTFSAANMAAFDKVNPLRFSMLLAGASISLAGLAVGRLIRHLRQRKSEH